MSGDTRLAFLGGGVMAEAIVNGVLSREVIKPDRITIGDPVDARLEYMASKYGVSVTSDNLRAIGDVDLIVVAVKPQHLGDLMSSLVTHVKKSQVIISIVAGASIETIQKGLQHLDVIRVMPNTPAQIGEGSVVWTSAPSVATKNLLIVERIVKTLGDGIYVYEEKYLDMATALSASGPAYVYLFLESLIDAGVSLGLSREISHRLAIQTIIGSASLAKNTNEHPAILRNNVTSPGGTTAAALQVMEQRGFKGIIIDAVWAAYKKALILG
jgi:pyrroline-5-carboxylate reductase